MTFKHVWKGRPKAPGVSVNQEAKVSSVAKLSTIDPNPMVPKPSKSSLALGLLFLEDQIQMAL